MSAVEYRIVNLILEGLYDGEKTYYRDLSVLVVGRLGS